ncbi:MAG: putative metal-dependent hydrolase, TIM-barrel fold [Bradyrhizobium sp.]|nr:putative metal-dependent hydrolase, TIM-barrel fold [Bradyrhizobium sp.]
MSKSPPPVSIDVHHHFNPTLRDNGGNPWSIEMALDELDANNVGTAIASLVPTHNPDGPDRHKLIRRWNEWATTICNDHPGRFGLFASIVLPDIDRSIEEIAYAFDVLQADGIGVSTNEGDTWLIDERYEPVFAELDRRRAVVFVHPARTTRCSSLSEAYGGDAVSSAWLEYPVNTARVILGLLTKGVMRRYPNIRFIFSHGGGVMPLLLGRIEGFRGWGTVGRSRLDALFPEGIYAEFRRFYFDTAQALAPEAIGMMRRLVPEDRLLFGSDFSYFRMSQGIKNLEDLGLDESLAKAIGGGNASQLFPRFDKDAKSQQLVD